MIFCCVVRSHAFILNWTGAEVIIGFLNVADSEHVYCSLRKVSELLLMDSEQVGTQEAPKEAWSPISVFCLTKLSFQGLHFL